MSRSARTQHANPFNAVARLALIAIAGLCLASPASADCTFKSGSSLGTATIALPANLSASRDAAVGSVLYDSGWVATNSGSTVICTGTNTLTYGYTDSMTPVAGNAHVYATGVSGIGIRVAWLNGMSGSPSMDAGSPIDWPAIVVTGVGASSYGPMGRFRVQLIVTGTITSGKFNLPSNLVQSSYNTLMVNALTLANNIGPVAASACRVQTPAIAVTMPQARLGSIPNVGSTTGDTGFKISLDCSGPVSVSLTLTDASQPANRSSTLSAASTSTASGMGYQVLYNSTPVSYGADSAIAGNANQFAAATVTGAGITTLPFLARYIRVGQVSAGTVNANATFTMSYQ